MKVYIGIDVGTSTISLAAMECAHGVMAAVRNVKNDSRLAQSPFLQDPARICALVLEQYGQLCEQFEVAAVGITCQMHGIVYVDREGRAVSPLYTWQDEMGEHAASDAATRRQALNAATGYEQVKGIATGSITHYCLTTAGAVPAGAVQFCTIGDYLAMVLTGRTAPLTHVSNAAGLGLFRLEDGCFDRNAIAWAGLDASHFPAVAFGCAMCGKTADGIPVSVALGDNQASFLGAVEDWEHEVLLNFGTGGQISQYSREVVQTDGLESRPFLDRDFITVYTSHCGGRAYAALELFFRQVLQMAGVAEQPLYEAMESALRQAADTEKTMLVAPAFCGTRAQPDKRCQITGVTLENFTPAHLTKAFLEGICRELMPAYLQFRERRAVYTLVGSGNTIRRNKTFQAMIEAQFGAPLRLPAHAEEAAMGACRFAAGMMRQ